VTRLQILEERFEGLDALLDSIAACEADLDPLLLPPEDETVSVLSAVATASAVSAPPELDRSAADLADGVAVRIKLERQKRGWRQKDLAAVTGIARPNIARLESGRRMPKLTTLHKLGQALGIPVEELLGGKS
jgi:ribosome-binding protein aMBF1 (putative translation factor)